MATPERPHTMAPVHRVDGGWTGWLGFAATTLILIGLFQAIEGIVALVKDDYFIVSTDELLISVDYTTWGWVHVGLGVMALITGVGMFTGALWARVLGIVFALLSAVTNLAFLGAYPVWSTLIIAFDVILIWALTVHGAEMKESH